MFVFSCKNFRNPQIQPPLERGLTKTPKAYGVAPWASLDSPPREAEEKGAAATAGGGW